MINNALAFAPMSGTALRGLAGNYPGLLSGPMQNPGAQIMPAAINGAQAMQRFMPGGLPPGLGDPANRGMPQFVNPGLPQWMLGRMMQPGSAPPPMGGWMQPGQGGQPSPFIDPRASMQSFLRPGGADILRRQFGRY